MAINTRTPTEIEDTLVSIDDGKDVEEASTRLAIESLETFGEIFRPLNLELLDANVELNPESIRELAQVVDRYPPEAHGDIHTKFGSYL